MQQIKRKKYEPIFQDEYQAFIDAFNAKEFDEKKLKSIDLPNFKRRFELINVILLKIKQKIDLNYLSKITSILLNKLSIDKNDDVDFFINTIYRNNPSNHLFLFNVMKYMDKINLCLLPIIIRHDKSNLEYVFEKITDLEVENVFNTLDIADYQSEYIFKGLVKNTNINYHKLFDWLIGKENDYAKILSYKLINFYFTTNNLKKGISELNENIYKLIKEDLRNKNDNIIYEVINFIQGFIINKEINDILIDLITIRCKIDNLTKEVIKILDISSLSQYDLDNFTKLVSLDIGSFVNVLDKINISEEMVNDLIIALGKTYDSNNEIVYNYIVPHVQSNHKIIILNSLEQDNSISRMYLLNLLDMVINTVDEMTYLTLCFILGNDSDKNVIVKTLSLLQNKRKEWSFDPKWINVIKLRKILLLIYPLIKVDDWYYKIFRSYEDNEIKAVIKEFYGDKLKDLK